MSDNLKLWDAVKRPPQDALKAFTRGGGFSGTAIKPMWAIKVMTEQFGPCGEGWGMNEPQFNVQSVGNEILVYCTVSIWYAKREKIVFGVGGDKILAVFKSGPKADDEAFKKAYTDAVTNALKYIGVGADIHMGLWDGSKYAVDDDAPERKPEGSNIAPMPPAHVGTKAGTMQDKDALCNEINKFNSVAMLKLWPQKPDVAARLADLHPDHAEVVRNSYIEKMNELKASLAA